MTPGVATFYVEYCSQEYHDLPRSDEANLSESHKLQNTDKEKTKRF